MKKYHLITIVLLAFLFSGIPFFIYATQYKGDFSVTNADWGNFGSFIGGTTSALLSTFSLLVLIFSLHITIKNFQKQIKDQQDNHIGQLNFQTKIHAEQKDLQNRIHQEQLKSQQDNHTEQLELQRKTHTEQIDLQNRIHQEQLKSQKEIHEKESDYTIFSTNMSLLNSHIKNLNEKLDSRDYNYYHTSSGEYINANEEKFLEHMKNALSIKLSKATSPNVRETFNLIYESKVSYSEELIALMNIIGIICNTNNERYKMNYVSIFLTSIKQERTYWLMCYAYESYVPMRDRIDELTKMLIIPEGIKKILKQYGAIA